MADDQETQNRDDFDPEKQSVEELGQALIRGIIRRESYDQVHARLEAYLQKGGDINAVFEGPIAPKQSSVVTILMSAVDTSLHYGVQEVPKDIFANDIESMVQAAFDKTGIDPDRITPSGRTEREELLLEARKREAAENQKNIVSGKPHKDITRIIQDLLDNNANPNQQAQVFDREQGPVMMTPLIAAIRLLVPQPNIVATLLADPRTDLNLPGEDGRAPLHAAMSKGYVQMLLAEPGIMVDPKDKQGCTPLGLAPNGGWNRRDIIALLDAGANPDTGCGKTRISTFHPDTGRSALCDAPVDAYPLTTSHRLSEQERSELIADNKLENPCVGADPKLLNLLRASQSIEADGVQLVHAAAKMGDSEILEALRLPRTPSAGFEREYSPVRFDQEDKNGDNIFHFIGLSLHMRPLSDVFNAAVAGVLASPGKDENDPRKKAKRERRALSEEEIQSILFPMMVKQNKQGNAPLHFAAGHSELVRELLERGVPVDPVNSNGDTPLMLAIQGRSPLAVQYLLDAGAAIQFTDKPSALELAQNYADARGLLDRINFYTNYKILEAQNRKEEQREWDKRTEGNFGTNAAERDSLLQIIDMISKEEARRAAAAEKAQPDAAPESILPPEAAAPTPPSGGGQQEPPAPFVDGASSAAAGHSAARKNRSAVSSARSYSASH